MGLLDSFVQDTPAQAPTGLLGQSFADPRSAAIMALASGLIRGDAGAGFLGANDAFQKSANANLQRADVAQQIGLRNIQLQQAMQKWKWLQDAMSGADAPQTQAAPNPDAPQIALGQGADLQPSLNLPDGSKLNTGGIGPTNANAQRMGGVAPVQVTMPSSNPYVAAGQALGITPKAAIMQSMMFPEAFNKAYGTALTPTDPTRLAIAAGQDPRTVNEAFIRKQTNLAPTRLGNGGYFDNLNQKFVPLPAAAQPGFINIPDATDPSGYRQIPVGNGPGAVRASSEAQAGGKAAGTAPYDNPVSIPLSDGRSVTLSKPEYAAYQQTGTLPARYASLQGAAPPVAAPAAAPAGAVTSSAPAGAQPAPTDRAAIYASEIAKTQDMIANPKKYMSPNMLMQDPAGAQFVTRAKGDLAALQSEVAKLGPQAAKVAGPVAATQATTPLVGVTPTLGTAPSQTAPSEQMKNDYATMAAAGPQATQSLEYLDHLLELAKKKPAYMGMGIGGLPLVDRFSTDAAEYEKARASYISAQGKALGSAGTDAARATIDQAVPEYGKPQEAMVRGLMDQRNQLVASMLRRQVLAPVYQTGNEKAYTEIANGFDQNIKPSMLPILSLPTPDAKRLAIKAAIAQNPSLRSNFEWAFNHGLAQ
jgi:hypothetical protein